MANHKAMTVWCNKYERVCFVSTVINNTQDCLDGCVCRLKAKPPTHPQNDSLCNQTPCGSTVMHHENMHENVSIQRKLFEQNIMIKLHVHCTGTYNVHVVDLLVILKLQLLHTKF